MPSAPSSTASLSLSMPYAPPAAMQVVPGFGSQSRAAVVARRHALRSAVRPVVLASLDLLALAIVDAAMHLLPPALVGPGSDGTSATPPGHLLSAPVATGVLLAIAILGTYGEGDRRRDPVRLFIGCAFGLALSSWEAAWAAPGIALPWLFSAATALTLAIMVTRGSLDLLTHYAVPFRSAAPRTLLVGAGDRCLEMLSRTALADQHGFQVVGVVDLHASPGDVLRDFEAELLDKRIDTLVVCGTVSEGAVARVLRAAAIAECEVLVLSGTLELPGVHPELVWRHGLPFLELRAAALRGHQMFAKRVLDVGITAIGLVVAAPLMALIAIAIRLESPGAPIFAQRRIGRHGRVFRCFKFRSMRIDAEAVLHADPALYAEYVRNDFKLPPERDTRITRVGRFLRRTSLDELPQLWNVLVGDMSLVGPRPIVVNELSHYGAEQPLFVSLKPGVTGAWQVNGRSDVAYPDRARVELDYVREWSLGRDIMILLKTVPAVLAQRGAH